MGISLFFQTYSIINLPVFHMPVVFLLAGSKTLSVCKFITRLWTIYYMKYWVGKYG